MQAQPATLSAVQRHAAQVEAENTALREQLHQAQANTQAQM